MWLTEVKAKAKRKNQIFFSKDSLLLDGLRQLVEQTNRRALVLWTLELAEETAVQLEAKYPDHRPGEAVEAAHAWAKGEIKMPIAKRAILNCHAMAKELNDQADIARCHAVGQACSTVHTVGHALGYPMYELTAIVLESGLDACRDAVQQRVAHYTERLLYWRGREPNHPGSWANFLRK